MTTEKTAVANTILTELFQVGVYKRSQGKITRQATFGALAIAVVIGAWRLHGYMEGAEWFEGARFVVPGIILAVGLWIGFRLVNYPRFADFLIAVEAEMNKVSWPSRRIVSKFVRGDLRAVLVIGRVVRFRRGVARLVSVDRRRAVGVRRWWACVTAKRHGEASQGAA